MDGFVIGPGAGDSYEFNGGEVCIKAMPEHTGLGGFSVETFPKGFASPWHVHHRDTGVFFVLEGTMHIRCGELDALASVGSMIFLPPGVPHAFRVEGDAPARWFSVQSPHGDFMLSTMARSRQSAAGTKAPAIETLGPPPF